MGDRRDGSDLDAVAVGTVAAVGPVAVNVMMASTAAAHPPAGTGEEQEPQQREQHPAAVRQCEQRQEPQPDQQRDGNARAPDPAVPRWSSSTPPTGPRRVAARTPCVVPAVVAVIAGVITLTVAGRWLGDMAGVRSPDAVAYGLLLAAAAVLTVRKIYPAPAIAVTTLVAIIYPELGYPPNGVFLLPLVIAVFSAMARGRPGPAIAGVVVYLAGFVALGVVPGEVEREALLSVPVWLAATLLAGEGARNRRAFFAEAHRRVTQAERTREEEERRRAGEERIASRGR